MVRSGLDKKVEVFVQDLVIQDLSLRKKEEENKVGGRMPVLKKKTIREKQPLYRETRINIKVANIK